MNAVEFRKSLEQRKPLFGTLIVSPSPSWAPAVAGLGLDYVFIDTEHIAIDRQTLSWMCRAYESAEFAPMVRITSPNPFEASAVLDGGAAAVLAPYVETVKQVRDLVGAVKCKPVKGQKLDAMLAGDSACAPQAAYATASNAGRSLLINIESVPAMEHLDELLAVDGVDGIVIGPHDLSVSLGIPEQWQHPRFVEAVETILSTARNHGVSAGIHMIYDEALDQYERWRDAGANLILHLADLLAFRFCMQREIAAIRHTMGAGGVTKGEDIHI
ncbi:aldolase/citrate lyase family protein [Pirellulales bacterium]|nr:aldolase/citrate lyase family protein [Pirellulales bacterium]